MKEKNNNNTLRSRKITICRKSVRRENQGYVDFPIINLSGKWLMENGFKIGQVIDIQYTNKKLMITVSKEQKFENKE